MVNEFKICPFCGSEITYGISCPNCQMNLTMVKQGANEVKNDWSTGKSVFKGIIRDSETIEEEMIDRISKQKNLRILKKREKFIENMITQFPEIKRKLIDEHDLTFSAYIIEIPHENEEGKFVHDCILQTLSKHFHGLMNFAIGGKELPDKRGHHVYNLPIFASKPYGDVLLSEQKDVLNSQLPKAQRRFLLRAEPWSVCDRIYKYPGRWVNWILLFDVRNLEKWIKEQNDTQAPLIAHEFSGFEYSSQFPIAGTKDKKEVMLVIINESEEDKLGKILRFFKERYMSRFNDTPDKFTISYTTLQELGLLQDSIYRKVVEQESFLFTHNLEKQIEPLLKEEVAKLGHTISVQSDKEEKKIRKDVIDILLEKYTKTWYDNVFHIVQTIPKQYRRLYTVEGRE